jgi:hypothetical protein
MNSLVIEPKVSAPLINLASEPNPDKDMHHEISHESRTSKRYSLNTVNSLYNEISSIIPHIKNRNETITVTTKDNKT